MKKIITTLVLALLSASITYAESPPDSMYIHFTATDGSDSIVVHALADIDSMVYYAPVVPEPPAGIDWDNVAAGEVQADALTDGDGNSYSAVKIGTQVWMAENLRTSTYADGTAIPTVTDDNTSGSTNDEWASLGDNNTDKAYCAYNNDANNESDTYGYLYTYAAATNGTPFVEGTSTSPVQGVCPQGWHLPSDAEWTSLEGAMSGDNKGCQLAGNSALWSTGNLTREEEFGTSGFTALPGGARRHDTGGFTSQSYTGHFWCSSTDQPDYAYYRYLDEFETEVDRDNYNKSLGYSVRCLRD